MTGVGVFGGAGGGLSITRQRPRIIRQVFDSLDDKLVDLATIERQVRQPGNSYGTPRYAVKKWGPFRARLSTPSGSETRDPDKWTIHDGFTLVMQSSTPPLEQDYITVASAKYGTQRYQATSTVQFRDAAWGEVLLYHVDLKRPTEGGPEGITANKLTASPSGVTTQEGTGM